MTDDDNCIDGQVANLSATTDTEPVIPTGYQQLFVLTSGEDLVIQAVNATPEFTVNQAGLFTIHSLVYNPETLDLGIVEFGVTTGFDVNGLIIQGGGEICASLDVAGAPFDVTECPCEALASTLESIPTCLDLLDEEALLVANVKEEGFVPTRYSSIFVLTSGTNLVIEAVSETPEFTVEEEGRFTIHNLVYNPETLDLGIIDLGKTTGFDVNALLIQGGGDICASLDVAGAPFDIEFCCGGSVGQLKAEPIKCSDDGAVLSARVKKLALLPSSLYRVQYVLTQGDDLTIIDFNGSPEFIVNERGIYRIHMLIYDPSSLDLDIVEFGETRAADVLGLLKQGGGDICALLDVDGVRFEVTDCIRSHKDVQIFPNPTNGRVQVEFNTALNKKPIRVDVFNSAGRIVRTHDFVAGTLRGEIDLSNSSQGLYLVRISYDGITKEWHRLNKTNP